MNLFQTIQTEARNQQLQFLVIGGLAVNIYGYSRDTADTDLLVSKEARKQWMELFAKLGYKVFHENEGFAQLSPPAANAWPVDFMFVKEKTFQPMLASAKPAQFFGITCMVPSLEHLIALKLHALKHTRMHRFLRDFLDVQELVRINKVDLKSENIRLLFSKYGTEDLYEKISKASAHE